MELLFEYRRNLFYIFWLICTFSYGQKIEILNERKLDLGLNDKILVENQLTINPNNQNKMLLSGMYVDPKNPDDFRDFAFISHNGGKNWKDLFISPTSETADPWGIFTNKGTALFSTLGEDINIYRYNEDTKKWTLSKSSSVGSNFDHQTLVVDRKRGVIYLVAIDNDDIYVNYSIDDGRSFLKPHRFKSNNLSSNTMVPVVLSDGTLLISYTDYVRPAINGSKRGGRGADLKNTLSWVVSFKPSSGFGIPSLISDSCQKGFPVMAIDATEGENKDNLYYVCSEQINNLVYSHYSNTRGKSWSLPLVVKQYHNQLRTKKNAFLGIPQVTVNNQGIVGVIWQDRTDDPKGACNRLYFTASLDGGKSFMDPVKVSSVQSCMEREENLWAGERYKSGGDYTGFNSNKEGSFIAIWADSREGISQYYSATIKVKK